MLGNGHVRFGRRVAETGRSKDRHRAAARPHTEHPTAEGKLYLCTVKDTCSGRIAGSSMDSRLNAAPGPRRAAPIARQRSGASSAVVIASASPCSSSSLGCDHGLG